MSELTLTIIRFGLLVLLWVFVFSVVGVLRGDIYGTRVVPRSPQRRDRRADRTAQRTAQRPDERGADRPAPAPRQRRRDTSRVPTSLTVVEGPLRGTSLPLRDAGVLIGRNPECALVLDDDYASGRHARIYRGDDGWYVEDLGSTNGTYLGSHRLTAAQRVEAGSVLRIGKTAVELRK